MLCCSSKNYDLIMSSDDNAPLWMALSENAEVHFELQAGSLSVYHINFMEKVTERYHCNSRYVFGKTSAKVS